MYFWKLVPTPLEDLLGPLILCFNAWVHSSKSNTYNWRSSVHQASDWNQKWRILHKIFCFKGWKHFLLEAHTMQTQPKLLGWTYEMTFCGAIRWLSAHLQSKLTIFFFFAEGTFFKRCTNVCWVTDTEYAASWISHLHTLCWCTHHPDADRDISAPPKGPLYPLPDNTPPLRGS